MLKDLDKHYNLNSNNQPSKDEFSEALPTWFELLLSENLEECLSKILPTITR